MTGAGRRISEGIGFWRDLHLQQQMKARERSLKSDSRSRKRSMSSVVACRAVKASVYESAASALMRMWQQ